MLKLYFIPCNKPELTLKLIGGPYELMTTTGVYDYQYYYRIATEDDANDTTIPTFASKHDLASASDYVYSVFHRSTSSEPKSGGLWFQKVNETAYAIWNSQYAKRESEVVMKHTNSEIKETKN